MAQRACLEERVLVVERRSARRAAEARSCVALQAEKVHIADLQHVRVRAAVRQMARLASIHLDGLVLIDKRPLLFGVALKANLVLIRSEAYLLRASRPVHVVAIAALDEPFIDAVMEWHLELGLLREVAGVAEFGLGLDEEKFLRFGVVRGVARDAAHPVLGVYGIDGIHVFGAAGVACQAARVDFFHGDALEGEDLGDVAAARDVFRTGTVTGFATLMSRTFLGVQSRLPVRGFFPIVIDIGVAGLADLRAHIGGPGLRVRRLGGRCFRVLRGGYGILTASRALIGKNKH